MVWESREMLCVALALEGSALLGLALLALALLGSVLLGLVSLALVLLALVSLATRTIHHPIRSCCKLHIAQSSCTLSTVVHIHRRANGTHCSCTATGS